MLTSSFDGYNENDADWAKPDPNPAAEFGFNPNPKNNFY